MIVTEVVCNLHDADPAEREALAGLHHEKVTLSSAELTKRVQRLETDHGRSFGLRLAGGSSDLRDGDVLIREEGNVVVVSVLPTDVLVIAPRSVAEALFVAHSLGNRHLQAQFFGAESEYAAEVMVVQYDHTVVTFLEDHGVAFARQERVMPVPFRHAEHTH
ncbi:urease accessory protein UreE [Zhihengliuella halotolerans]|uniref:Urease accessory protein UreE n=1 Tax=Zhihengliuella halotolerans TaxID=370736 RepID=A0A4Q8ADH3_9MICC|nr:urease accessory protein UreE [Zhihengliuella halotolerans]RZU62248.1 urease accessory protein [Zhihengliuella halotolerans]